MKLVLTRDTFTRRSTIGQLTIDGAPAGYVLEDVDRGLDQSMSLDEIARTKVHGATAIPTGEYVVLRTYSPRFKRVLPQLLDVPGFAGIRIHPGNDSGDTEGCLLPGLSASTDHVEHSRDAFAAIDAALIEAAAKNERVTITIQRDAASATDALGGQP